MEHTDQKNLKELIQILFVGKTGQGKSSAIQSLFDHENLKEIFEASPSTKAVTLKCNFAQCYWKMTSEVVMVTDTPGLSESQLADINHIYNIVFTIKAQEYVNAIFIVQNGTEQRIDQSTLDMLKAFQECFGPDFVKHLGFIFTKWSQTHQAQMIRWKKKDTEEIKKANFLECLRNNNFFENGFDTDEIGFFFIDNCFNEFEIHELEDTFEQQQLQMHAQTLQDIKKFCEKKPKFSSLEFQEVIKQNKSLEQKLEETQEEVNQLKSDLAIERNTVSKFKEENENQQRKIQELKAQSWCQYQ